jgi:hypothetical protein
MPLASMFANNSWQDDLDDLAGLLGSHPTDEDPDDQNATLDQALKDLFGG